MYLTYIEFLDYQRKIRDDTLKYSTIVTQDYLCTLCEVDEVTPPAGVILPKNVLLSPKDFMDGCGAHTWNEYIESQPMHYRKDALKHHAKIVLVDVNWKGLTGFILRDQLKRVLVWGICHWCHEAGKISDFDVHHVDHNPKNNNLDNLAIGHHNCHTDYHTDDKKMRKKERDDKTLLLAQQMGLVESGVTT